MPSKGQLQRDVHCIFLPRLLTSQGTLPWHRVLLSLWDTLSTASLIQGYLHQNPTLLGGLIDTSHPGPHLEQR